MQRIGARIGCQQTRIGVKVWVILGGRDDLLGMTRADAHVRSGGAGTRAQALCKKARRTRLLRSRIRHLRQRALARPRLVVVRTAQMRRERLGRGE
eukprot:5968159-Pleurochrysis_carterae.AAC.3